MTAAVIAMTPPAVNADVWGDPSPLRFNRPDHALGRMFYAVQSLQQPAWLVMAFDAPC